MTKRSRTPNGDRRKSFTPTKRSASDGRPTTGFKLHTPEQDVRSALEGAFGPLIPASSELLVGYSRRDDTFDLTDQYLADTYSQVLQATKQLDGLKHRHPTIRSAAIEIAARDELIANLQAQIAFIQRSTSWRLTRPLRAFAVRARKASSHYFGLRRAAVNSFASLSRLAIVPRLVAERRPTYRRPINIVAIGDGKIASTILIFDMSLQRAANDLGARFTTYYESDWPDTNILENADIVFMMRVCSDRAVRTAQMCVKSGVALIYMLDDDFGSLDPDTPLGARYAQMGAERNVAKITALADLTVVWSRAFMKKLGRTARRLEVFNAVANLEIFDRLPRPKPRREPNAVRFGYAGGATHANDVSSIRNPLIAHLEAHPDHVFESIGLQIDWLVGHRQYRYFPGNADMRLYYKALIDRQWDFAVAPLQDTDFNSAKSDNKYREYAGAGIPAIFSKVPAYEPIIQHSVNGMLASSDDEWALALRDMSTHIGLRRAIISAAQADVRSRMTAESVAEQYSRVIDRFVVPEKVIAAGPRHLPTFAIDVDVPFRLLGEQRRARLRRREIAGVTEEDLLWGGTLIIVRAFEPDAYDLVQRAKAAGLKVVYSLDDNWLDFPNDGSPSSEHVHSAANQASLKKIMSGADLIKASTPAIETAAKRFNKNVARYPYGFDFDLVEGQPTFRRDGKIRVGYFGTPGRDSQFNFVIDALKIAQSQLNNLEIEFLGFVPERVGELGNVRTLPFLSDYGSSLRVLANRQWDIGLSPLTDTPFNRAKLPTKFRDYGATGAVGLYSRLPSYEDVVVTGETGLLISNDAGPWADAITTLALDDDLREHIALNAFNYVRRNLSAERAAEDWMRVLDRLNAD